MVRVALVFAALVLGYISPWLASADNGLLLHLWFNFLPEIAAQWIWTDNLPLALAVDVCVLAAQYLGLFAVVGRFRPLANIAADFIHGPRHRRGLVR
jgi:hypothetical protein